MTSSFASFEAGSRPMIVNPRHHLGLIESTHHRCRADNSAHLIALVRAGATFENDALVERPDESASSDTHAA
jgi:hypothetical protein